MVEKPAKGYKILQNLWPRMSLSCRMQTDGKYLKEISLLVDAALLFLPW